MTMTMPSPHISSKPNGVLEFSPKAVQIFVLDQRGGILWAGTRASFDKPIQWPGIDTRGDAVPAGTYTCKIVYEDREVVYLPFVFIKP